MQAGHTQEGDPQPLPAEVPAPWTDETACQADAQALAGVWGASAGLSDSPLDATVTLAGDLGSGKTTFVRHLLRALGVTGRIKSPTYALVETHDLPGLGTAQHLDLYRLVDADDWHERGLSELWREPALRLIEWPERALSALPGVDLAMRIEPPRLRQEAPSKRTTSDELEAAVEQPGDSLRLAFVQAMSPRGRKWLVQWRGDGHGSADRTGASGSISE